MTSESRLLNIFFIGFVVLLATGCNMDDEIDAVAKPVIEFDHADGIYSVIVGEELTLTPMVENGNGAEYQWTIDGEVVGSSPELTRRWTEVGEFFVLLTVRNAGGVDREEVRVDVSALLPPSISLPLSSDAIEVQRGTTYLFNPLIGNLAKGEEAEIQWFVDGELRGDGPQFCFEGERLGVFDVEIRVSGSGGTASRKISVSVVERLSGRLAFVPLSLGYRENERSTIVGRPVALQLAADNISGPIVWSVDGRKSDVDGTMFVFTPQNAGSYQISASAGGITAMMEVKVYASASASAYASVGASARVWEWMPAPGQFIGEQSSVGGMTGDIATHHQACEWAEERLACNRFVSLGAWGGYIIMSLDGAIRNNGGGYDFAIMSNAITTSNEPGIVSVMQDVNGNGLPDDEWYELRGSDFDCEGAERNARVTYYRPSADRMCIQWVDASGASGLVDYIAATHNQPTYYPAWVDCDSYTLYGSRLPARNSQNPVSGLWTNEPFGWGYADNLGSDLLQGGDTQSGLGQWVGFRISNAVTPDGSSVSLNHIDFIKVQTGVMASSGRLGELSTEVCGLKVVL